MIRNTLTLFSVILLAVLTPGYIFAQGYSIKGTVTDRSTSETIPGVTVGIEGSSTATVTDADGLFELTVSDEKVVLSFKHILYKPRLVEVNKKSGSINFIGTITLESNIITLGEIKVLSSYVTDRSTPVAISAVSSKTIEQKMGNQDYPEIMKMTPGIYATKEGGGSGDDRLKLR